MTSDAPSALGPLFGPDFIVITVNDDTNKAYQLEVYPDANNPLLKASHLPQQYYFVPSRIYLAKKQDAPADFDFGMTVFKGLMTSEDTVGITPGMTSGGDVEAGGGFCTFSTTFAVPPSVIANAIAALKKKNYGNTPAPRLAQYMQYETGDPDPLLGIVPILDNDVTISVPNFALDGSPQAPLEIDAQSAKKGSIEASGISSFLVTCNQLAAGAIAGSLKSGVSPFTVNYLLTEQYYLPACDITVSIDMDKTFSSFSAAVQASGFFDSASFNYAYTNAVTSGGITTDMKINEAAIPDDLKAFVEQTCQQMQQNAMNFVKSELFDWQPNDGGQAQTKGGGGGLFGAIFGVGTQVAMKATYQKRSIHTSTRFTLDTSITKSDTKSGDLNDLEPAIKANLGKYLAIVDIGEYFKKIQIAGTNAVNWNEKLADGTNLSDPLTSVMLEVSYPDYSASTDSAGNPNLKTLGQGYHYTVGSATGNESLAQWNATNPLDVVNIAYLRLDAPLAKWPADQVKIRKTLVFDAADARVDVSANPMVIESTGNDHTPVITGAEVGYVYAKFLCRPIPSAVTVTITTTLGNRSDTITLTSQNQHSVVWEIFSDKYLAQTSFSYSVQVQVIGPDWTDNPIVYASSAPISVALQPGSVKYAGIVSLQLPPAPADKATQINDYIRRFQLTPVASGT